MNRTRQVAGVGTRFPRHALIGINAAVAVLGGQRPLNAQDTTSRLVLSRVVSAYTLPFSSISGFLAAGERVFVSDRREKLVLSINWRAGTADTIGRVGSGPDEYKDPEKLLPFVADSVLLHDPGNRRFLVISPAGTPGRTINIPPEIVFSVVGGADSLGRIYFQGPGRETRVRGRLVMEDSVPIIRWEPASGKIDSIASVKKELTLVVRPRYSGPGTVSTYRFPQPFSPRDEWAVTRGGRLWIASADPYQVSWVVSATQRTVGPVVPYSPVKVTEADREPYTSATFEVEWEFTEFKPAIRSGILIGGAGVEFWARRHTNQTDSTRYDVFNDAARRTHFVYLSANRTVVGVGDRNVYVVRRDTVDLLWLEVYERGGL